MSCSECKYNLHIPCFHLPPQTYSLPIHGDGHRLLLKSSDNLKPWEYGYCRVCESYTNGLYYACRDCQFTADIKCACMPDTIHHAAHPKHLLKHVIKLVLFKDTYSRSLSCAAGCSGVRAHNYDCYRCTSSSSCDFVVHLQCALLPASVAGSRWDERHPLPLTYNATQNHPGYFYCDQCETRMNPKRWMYHCRRCDLSFHPYCFKTASGWCRNIKLGQEYVNARAHPQTLTYQLLTTKRRCDMCGGDGHERLGFLIGS
ncbi:hypothetical protein AAHA92_19579 [Salvia divinorum]|uniref:Phorbol-ester/DAG-type domain-containing protein n=1 Tax=Salvia divinorum TaxID=28513 RepID=A0ABD1H5S0_SALDI